MALDSVKILYKGGTAEIEVKKSRFIAYTSPVHTVEEANAFIAGIRQRHWDATHNVPAFVLRSGVQRSSDDGEPGGTAGMPVLDVLLKSGVQDVCVVVTRYFGGTLLGTGGLVRAYSGAVQEGLSNSTIVEKCLGRQLDITTDYTGIGKIQYILAQNQIITLDTQYTDKVQVSAMVPQEKLDSIVAEITEGTSGRAELLEGDPVYYGLLDGEIVVF